jgi:hypothetical protein
MGFFRRNFIRIALIVIILLWLAALWMTGAPADSTLPAAR